MVPFSQRFLDSVSLPHIYLYFLFFMFVIPDNIKFNFTPSSFFSVWGSVWEGSHEELVSRVHSGQTAPAYSMGKTLPSFSYCSHTSSLSFPVNIDQLFWVSPHPIFSFRFSLCRSDNMLFEAIGGVSCCLYFEICGNTFLSSFVINVVCEFLVLLSNWSASF